MTNGRSVLYLIVCAAPRAKRTPHLVGLLHEAGWDVCVVATPQALNFIDAKELGQLTGRPVRSTYKHPDEPDVLPPADAMVVCPATFNTVNKWALGIADTLALGLITEAIGTGVKLVAAPSLNNAQEKHPAFARSIAVLRECGVTVLYGPGVYEPTVPGTGGRDYEWGRIVEAVGRPAHSGDEPEDDADRQDYVRLRQEYHRRTLETIDLLTKVNGYNASYFRRMVLETDAVDASVKLVHGPPTSQGFQRLWELGKLEYSVEAAVLNPKYEILFNDNDREVARRRLEDHGFDTAAYLRSLPADDN